MCLLLNTSLLSKAKTWFVFSFNSWISCYKIYHLHIKGFLGLTPLLNLYFLYQIERRVVRLSDTLAYSYTNTL